MGYNIDSLAEQLAEEIKGQLFIEVEASGRHVHLSAGAVDILFGKGYQLTPDKPLSQPGQYACKERLTLTGPKGSIHKVVVLGPTRPETQIELSLTDGVILGIKPPIRQSGDIANSVGVTLSSDLATMHIHQGAIVAWRHIHMTPEDGKKFGVNDGELVSVKVFSDRPTVFQDTLVRINASYTTRMHIDYDEANACGFRKGALGMIIKG